MHNDTILAQRFLAENPGATLIAIDDCAIPAKVLVVSMVTQKRKSIPLLAEFVIRSIAVGVASAEELSKFLGFPEDDTVIDCIADLTSEGVINLSSDGQLSLTSIGKTRSRELVEIVSEIKSQEFLFDQCGWGLSSASPSEKISRNRVVSDDILVLPAKSKASIDEKLITTEAVVSALNLDRSETKQFDILRIEGVIKKKPRDYIPGKILIYTSAEDSLTRVAVSVSGKFLPENEKVVFEKGGAEALGISVEDVPLSIELPSEILNQITQISQEEKLISLAENPDEESISKTSITRQAFEIGTFEHWPLLNKAITSCKRRLFINSPWISPQIVNDDLLTKLEACIRRGVNVTIAYGFGENDEREKWESFKRTVRSLESLDFRYPNFNFVRHGNTHAKQLIFDDTSVIGSFNWLSFKGDKQLEYRQEKSFVVSLPGIADNSYIKALEELESQGVMKIRKNGENKDGNLIAISSSKLAPGDSVEAVVNNITNFGVFLEIRPGLDGLLHISQSGCESPEDLRSDYLEGQIVAVRITEITMDPSGKFRYSLALN